MGSDVIYFSINNWFRGRDYPIGEPFDSWMREYKLTDEWCKENKICGKYDLYRVFELTSFEAQPLNTSNAYVAPKKKVIHVCGKCYDGLNGLRSGNVFGRFSNLSNY